jgi:hypothetical protein
MSSKSIVVDLDGANVPDSITIEIRFASKSLIRQRWLKMQSAERQAEGLARLIEGWKRQFGRQRVSAAVLADTAQEIDLLPVHRDKTGRISSRSLGKFLRHYCGVVISGSVICSASRHGSTMYWLVDDFDGCQ